MKQIQQAELQRRTLFEPTVIRPMPGHDGSWLLMNRKENGFASSSLPFSSLEELLDEWDVRIGPCGEDEHGRYLEVVPLMVMER